MPASTARSARRWWTPWAKGLGVLVGLQFLLFGLLVAGQAVPDEPIAENLVASVEAGTYGPSQIPDRMGTPSDTFTECVVAGTGLGASPEESALSRAARMPRIGNCDGGAEDVRAVADGKVFEDQNYYKYWAGYTVITRPALALVGLEGLRILSGALMVAAFVGALLAVRARTSTAVAVALTAPYLVGTNMLSTPSTSFSQSISIAFIFLSVLLTAVGAGRSRSAGLLGAAVGAALFCYVDLLTTPSVPWAMSAFVLAAAVWYRTRDLRRSAVAGVLAAAVWPAAFAVTWASRWAFGALFMGVDETVAMVQQNVGFRTGGAHAGVSDAFGAGLAGNVSYWWGMIPTSGAVLLACAVATAVGLVLAVRRGGPRRLVVALVLALPAVVVPVWYVALSNHSQIHEFFVNRGVPTALAVITAAALAAAVPSRPRAGGEAGEERPDAVPDDERVLV